MGKEECEREAAEKQQKLFVLSKNGRGNGESDGKKQHWQIYYFTSSLKTFIRLKCFQQKVIIIFHDVRLKHRREENENEIRVKSRFFVSNLLRSRQRCHMAYKLSSLSFHEQFHICVQFVRRVVVDC